jgi:hypothetical protein
MVHKFPYAVFIDPYIRLFVSSIHGTFSPYPAFQPRGISVGIPFLFEWLQPSFCRIYLYFKPHDSVCHDACRSIGGMVSGYMVPSFPSSVVKLRLFNFDLLPFTLSSTYSRTCRAPLNTHPLYSTPQRYPHFQSPLRHP